MTKYISFCQKSNTILVQSQPQELEFVLHRSTKEKEKKNFIQEKVFFVEVIYSSLYLVTNHGAHIINLRFRMIWCANIISLKS